MKTWSPPPDRRALMTRSRGVERPKLRVSTGHWTTKSLRRD